jgi:hypothetical protein
MLPREFLRVSVRRYDLRDRFGGGEFTAADVGSGSQGVGRGRRSRMTAVWPQRTSTAHPLGGCSRSKPATVTWGSYAQWHRSPCLLRRIATYSFSCYLHTRWPLNDESRRQCSTGTAWSCFSAPPSARAIRPAWSGRRVSHSQAVRPGTAEVSSHACPAERSKCSTCGTGHPALKAQLSRLISSSTSKILRPIQANASARPERMRAQPTRARST